MSRQAMTYIFPKRIVEFLYAFLERLKLRNVDVFKDSKNLDTSFATRKLAPAEAIPNIWGHGGFKVFLSHLARDKEEVSELQRQLEVFGVSCFVAHLNIRPTKEWQEEIETALFSMDALIAILTKDFQKSNWTDQEIGIALGRKVPVIPLKIEKNPYGFIGKIQAIPYSWDAPATKIIKYLMKYDKMVDAYLSAVHHCPNFESGLKLAEILPFLENLSDKQLEILISAFNQNSQVRGCWGFSGDYSSSKYGKGLVFHLNRLAGKVYKRDSSDKIVLS